MSKQTYICPRCKADLLVKGYNEVRSKMWEVKKHQFVNGEEFTTTNSEIEEHYIECYNCNNVMDCDEVEDLFTNEES